GVDGFAHGASVTERTGVRRPWTRVRRTIEPFWPIVERHFDEAEFLSDQRSGGHRRDDASCPAHAETPPGDLARRGAAPAHAHARARRAAGWQREADAVGRRGAGAGQL